ncbi:hypothetical protein AMECASPLE_036936 [Ameca splendens]|uniref:Uncharacterized protein n=1 Tax=Ameca splendens TaxID=208324 RepID=A0ABV1AF58_9TELE
MTQQEQAIYSFGEYQHLLQELHLDEGCFKQYFCLSRSQSRIGGQISLRDTNYRRYISLAERLSICLQHVATGDSGQ